METIAHGEGGYGESKGSSFLSAMPLEPTFGRASNMARAVHPDRPMQLARVIAIAAAIGSTQGVSSSPAKAQGPGGAQEPPAGAQGPGSNASEVSPDADRLLRRMSDFLGQQKEFSVEVDGTTEAIYRTGQKIQVHSTGMGYVRRPGQRRMEKTGDDGSALALSDGRTFTFYTKRQNGYVSVPASATLDETLAKVEESGKIELPGADLLYRDSYAGLMDDVVSGESLGASVVQGTPTQHLAFRGRDVDWQIWIEDGPRPLPRKYVITSKNIEGAPEYEILLSDWNLDPKLPDDLFKFKPPPGAAPIGTNTPASPRTPH